MKFNILGVISKVLFALLITLGAYLLYVNLRIGIAFLAESFMVIVFIFALINIIIPLKEKTKVPVFMVIYAIIYLFFLMIPTLNFYIDLYSYSNGNYDEHTGIVTEISVQGLETTVEIDEQSYSFYGSFDLQDLDIGKKIQVNFLQRSKIAINYELIK